MSDGIFLGARLGNLSIDDANKSIITGHVSALTLCVKNLHGVEVNWERYSPCKEFQILLSTHQTMSLWKMLLLMLLVMILAMLLVMVPTTPPAGTTTTTPTRPPVTPRTGSTASFTRPKLSKTSKRSSGGSGFRRLYFLEASAPHICTASALRT